MATARLAMKTQVLADLNHLPVNQVGTAVTL